MKKFVIFGNPVKHSKSPQMHNSAFDRFNIDAKYTKYLLEDASSLKDVFINENLSGANITVPHKEEAFKQADEVLGLAKRIKAVNTYVNDNGKIKAYNTDAPGFMLAIEEFLPNIKKAVVLGAGGTARALCVALLDKDIKVTVINRSSNRLDFFKELGCEVFTQDNYDFKSEFDLIVNATSVGLVSDDYPTKIELLNHFKKSAKYAFDVVYGKDTLFKKFAKQNSISIKDGEDMLIYQGILAFELFSGITGQTKELYKIFKESFHKEG